MEQINIYLKQPAQLIGTLTKDKSLIFNDDGHVKTMGKFTLITAASPLVGLARVIRGIAFAWDGQFQRGAREFIGGLATPLVAAACLTGTLISSLVYVVSCRQKTGYIQMRRAYAFFEAWMNQIDLRSQKLATYSDRVSDPVDFLNKKVWTLAPCMQPILEQGRSDKGGLRDVHRIQKMFPLMQINSIHLKGRDIEIDASHHGQSDYSTCCGAIEHSRRTTEFCCFRIDAFYTRFLCYEMGNGSCSTTCDPNSSLGITTCSCCGLGACCCYVKDNNNFNIIDTTYAC